MQNNNQESIFRKLVEKAQNIEGQWNNIYQGLCAAQTDFPHLDINHFNQLNDKFQAAVQRLYSDLESPTLILATTGTTSSGKSTIVNLLCGADIMPRMAQEMSAGVVYIHHSSDNKRHLKIHNTENAKWECGEWHDLNDTEIREKLTQVMDNFNANKGINQPEVPQIELTYPLACFNNPDLLALSSLPKSTQFKLMDLPGLRNHQDNINNEVIKNCRDALCLVAYNMEETDENRRRDLVEQVLEQVKNMGGSPARMLFVLNRIDVFRKDNNWERYQEEHIAKTKKEITDILHEHLPEHRDILTQLTYSRLSSLPALHSQRIKIGADRVHAGKEIDKHFKSLIAEEICDDLVNVNSWKDHDFERVSDDVWKNSYGAEFFMSLDKHIKCHFPNLVIPTILNRFKKETDEITLQINGVCYGELNSSKEKYEQACLILEKQKNELHEFLNTSKQKLLKPLNEFSDESNKNKLDPAHSLETASESLIRTDIINSAITKEQLSPLWDWHHNLETTSLVILEIVQQSIDNKKFYFSNTQSEKLPREIKNILETACRDYIESIKKSEKEKYDEQLNQFLNQLNKVIHQSLEIKIHQENNRIHNTIELITKSYLAYLRRGIDSLAPESSLKVPDYIHDKFETPSTHSSNIFSSVKVKTEDTYSSTVLLTSSAANALRMVILGSTPWGWALTAGMLVAGAMSDNEKKTLPDGKNIYDSGKKILDETLQSLVIQFYDLIQKYIEDLTNAAEFETDIVFNAFQDKLNTSRKEHQGKLENIHSIWWPLGVKTKELEKLIIDIK